MHDLLNPAGSYTPESEQQALARYSGFAATFFTSLYLHFPSLAGEVQFFRDDAQPDLWAICGTGPSAFGVQLDPDIEVICLWTKSTHEEVGAWHADPIAHAIEWVRTTYRAPTKTEVLQQWLEMAKDDPVLVDPDDIRHEARSNLWCFSPRDEQTAGITLAGLCALIKAIVEARRNSVGANTMLFYGWHDAQARQLRFSLVSHAHGRLPFACETRPTDDVAQIAEHLYADWHELPAHTENTEPQRSILTVFVATLA